jgi:hypothetical protein
MSGCNYIYAPFLDARRDAVQDARTVFRTIYLATAESYLAETDANPVERTHVHLYFGLGSGRAPYLHSPSSGSTSMRRKSGPMRQYTNFKLG